MDDNSKRFDAVRSRRAACLAVVAQTDIEAKTNAKSMSEEEIEIISNLDLMISMDSANGHIAANYNIPVITLWGLTHPFAGFSPFLSLSENMIVSNRKQYPQIPTSAYGNKTPKGYENVMRTIDVSDVILAVNKVL